ncbi:MAG TPA: hypothetical protein DCL76_02420 [Chloroflexi bacterium]|nr:hypothetical protein [Chloroflexota bacterium]
MSNWIIVFLLLLTNFVLAVFRAVFLNVSSSDLDEYNNKFDTGVKIARMVIDDSKRLYVTLQFIQSFVKILLVAYSFELLFSVNQTMSYIEIFLFSLFYSIVLLIITDFCARSLVMHRPALWSVRLSAAMLGLTWVSSPITSFMQFVARALGVSISARERMLVTPDQIKDLVDVGEEGGSIEQDERQMIHSVFQFSDTLVREVMIPRIDVLSLDVKTSLSDVYTAVVHSGYSRIPVYDDTVDNIIGLLYAKDLLESHNSNNEVPVLRDVLRKPFFVPETKKIDALLPELQGQRMHMAIVVDEYGGMAGVVTLEDLVEELIGEVQDEYDLVEDVPLRQIGDDEFLVQGRIDIDDFNRKLQANLDGGDSDTLAGLIFERLGRVPVLEEIIEIDGFVLEVHKVVDRQIRWVRVLRKS